MTCDRAQWFAAGVVLTLAALYVIAYLVNRSRRPQHVERLDPPFCSAEGCDELAEFDLADPRPYCPSHHKD